jgi:predicted TIM-barrel fold metal-dependent hydrolase
MADYKIISADSHVSEPSDLWTKRIDKEFRFRAPRMEQLERDGKIEDFFLYEGWPPHPVGAGLGAAGHTRDGNNGAFRAERRGYDEAKSGGWDPVQRLIDQDEDGVEAEVLHTTLAFRLFWLEDAPLQRACFRAYNDWLAEFCSHSPKRLMGVPLISIYDIDEAIKELDRAHSIGLHGCMIPLSPHASLPPYYSKIYDPLWAAIEATGKPAVLHEITGGAHESKLSAAAYWRPDWSMATLIRPQEVMRTLGQLILSGVFERFPNLRVISAENGTDWLPWYVNRMSRATNTSFGDYLSLKPIDYFHRQVSFTYINEPHIVKGRDIVGVDNLMFATDYPHSASTYPNSEKIVDRDTLDIPADERRKLIHDNVLRIYGMPVEAIA